MADIAVLDKEAARDVAEGEAGRIGIGEFARGEEAEVLFLLEDGDGVISGRRGDDDFGEDLDDLAGRVGVERAVEGDNAGALSPLRIERSAPSSTLTTREKASVLPPGQVNWCGAGSGGKVMNNFRSLRRQPSYLIIFFTKSGG